MSNLQVKVKVKPISKDDLAKKIASLNPDERLYFWVRQDEDGAGDEVYGVRFIEEFKAWVILINVYGGGASAEIDYYPGETHEKDLKRLSEWLHDYFNRIGSHTLFISEVHD